MRKTQINPNELPPLDRATLRRSLACLQPYSPRVALVIVCIAAGAALNLALPWFIKRIVDEAIPHRDIRLLWLYCCGMVAGPAIAGLLQVVQKYGAESIGQRVMVDLRVSLYRHLQQMPLAFFAKQRPGEAVSRVLNDVQGVGGAVSGTLVDVVQNIVVLVSTAAFIFALEWRLAFVALGLLPMFIVPTRRVGRRRKELRRRLQEHVGELTGMLTETLSISGALLVKVSGGERIEAQRVAGKTEQVSQLSLQQSLVGRWFQMLLGLFEAAGPAIVFAIGGVLVINGDIAVGTIVAFVTALKRLYGPASSLAGVYVDLMTSYAYFERVFSLLDQTPSIREAPNAIAPTSVNGAIEFRNVSFTYDASIDALSNIDLVVPAGRTVAIVGPSGAGKSTIASLALRLYDPTEGSVTIDGIDTRLLKTTSLREHVAVVMQDTFLFHATVLENLRYAAPSASFADVVAAARDAEIHDLIASLPEGYDTIVGERGYRFSVGERQRLAIARAILRDPRILILDEATSSLDAVSERHVQRALATVRTGRTCVVIAHRLSTVRDADLIVVLDRGRIVERGTHDQLLMRSGLYARLWRIQAGDEHRARPDSAQLLHAVG